MPELPVGTLTFLFTDLEGSTDLWQRYPEAMRAGAARHDALLRHAIEAGGGHVVKTTGDGFHAAFSEAPAALAAALTAQQALSREDWGGLPALKVRMGLHTASAELRDGDYYGPGINRAARLMAAGHGGQVLLSLATEELTCDHLPDSVALKDLGEHRLKDLGRPEQAFQLCHPDLPSDFPSLRSLDVLPNNLPIQLTSFIGREKEMAEVKAMLGVQEVSVSAVQAPDLNPQSPQPLNARPPTRLLTLTGSGGCGKSRLSLQVAADLLDRYPAGVWLVELAPLTDPALVPSAVAAVLDVPPDSGRPVLQSLIDFVKPRSLLLILDNCEHLLGACAALADSLLRACPRLRILASSREGLSIAGEITYRIPSMTAPDLQPGELLHAASLQHYESVQLFADRAAFSKPGFAMTEQNAPALAQICRRLDGIPLALELAAARVKAMTVEQIASRLDDRFRLLTGGSRTALPTTYGKDFWPAEASARAALGEGAFAAAWAEGAGMTLEQAAAYAMASRLAPA